MSKIIKLSNSVIPKIAAGEVVDRPASIIKELLENSIDAAAKNIYIEIENGGTTLIKIVDDGFGMDKEDLKNCYLHHTTSKLVTIDDLNNLSTFGFRGEALSSIAAVSRLSIKSRPHAKPSGFELSVDFGNVPDIKSCSMDYGTIIVVKDLFGNVPARRKFLKASSYEYKLIMRVVTAFLLANPLVNITLSHEGKISILGKALGDYPGRLQFAFGQNIVHAMFPYTSELDRFSIHGFLSKPQVASSSALNQYIIVNGRYVRSSIVNAALRDAYGSFLEPKANPPYVININVDAGLIDVNVHPRKEEIRFWDDAAVYDAITNEVKRILSTNNVAFSYDIPGDSAISIKQKAAKSAFIKLKDSVSRWEPDLINKIPAVEPFQFERNYIIYPQDSCIVLIDQHAAHESILFVQYKESFLEGKLLFDTYLFKEAVLISLSATDYITLLENSFVLNSLGFKFEDFGSNTIKVTQIPEIFKSYNLSKLLVELSENFSNSKNTNSIDSQTLNTLEFLSCRGAVKSGDFLDLAEMKNIIVKLDENPYLYNTCPHGRPVKVTLGLKAIEKLFYRR